MPVKAWADMYKAFLGDLLDENKEMRMSDKKTVAAELTVVADDRVDEQKKVIQQVEELNNRMTQSLLGVAGRSMRKIENAMEAAVSNIQTAFIVADMKYRNEALDKILGYIEQQREEVEAKLKTAKGRMVSHYQKQLQILTAREDQAIEQLTAAPDEDEKGGTRLLAPAKE